MDDAASATPGSVREAFGRVRGDGRGWTLVFVAAAWLFIAGFRVVLPALLPNIKADLAISNAEAGFALTVLWGIYAVLQFPAGLGADRTGERPWIVWGALLGALSLAGVFIAPVYVLFVVACGLFGLGSGLFGTPRDMLLTRTYPTADNTAYAITFAAGSFGAGVLPFVATAIAARFDWRVAVVWMLPLLFVAGIGLWWAVPQRDREDLGELSAVETGRQALTALADPPVLIAGTVMLLFIFTYQGFASFLPTYLIEVKGLAPGTASVLFGSLFVLGAAVQPLVGTIADRFGAWRTQLVLIAISTAVLGALPFVGGVALWVIVPLIGIRIAIGPLASAFIVRALPDPVKGSGWGLFRTLFFSLGAMASTVIGILADADRFDAGFLLLAGLTGLAGVVWFFLPRSDTS